MTHFPTVYSATFSTFKERMVAPLSTSQKNVIVLAAIAVFACLATVFYLLTHRNPVTRQRREQNAPRVGLNEHSLQIQPQPTQAAPTLYFYDRSQRYYELTNFFENMRHDGLHPVMYNGQAWKTAEHAFQAEKFNDGSSQGQIIRTQIAGAPSARTAYDIAQVNSKLSRHNWHQIKDNVMLNILRSKFSDPHLSNVLKKTNVRPLVEASPVDGYWGYGPDKKGLNRLGTLLMQVRKERFGF